MSIKTSDKAVLLLFFPLLMRPIDSASALTTTFFLDGLFGNTLFTFLNAFPMDCFCNLGVAGPPWVFCV